MKILMTVAVLLLAAGAFGQTLSGGGGTVPGSNCGDTSHALGWNGAYTCQAISGSAAAGGSNTQIQFNNATALGGVSQWTSNGTTGITGSATSVLTLADGSTWNSTGPSFAAAVNLPTGSKLNGTALTSVFQALLSGTGLARNTGASAELSGDATTSGSNAVTVVKINGTLLSGLATGILKNTTATGVPSIATANTDYLPVASPTATGTATVATLAATTINGAALSGTFTGTPTLSGALTLSGSWVGGTPASMTGTNITGIPAANILAGTMASGMVLVAPALGTPASGVITSLTGTCGSCVANSATAVPAANVTAGALASTMTATTQTAKDNSTKLATTAYVDRPTGLTTGTSITLAAPRQYFICTSTCTITMPVPAAGDEFCVQNNVAVSTVITFAAIGSSSFYGKTDQSAYGTSGTGTLVSGGAAGDKMCLLGVDATHYNVASFNGVWTAN